MLGEMHFGIARWCNFAPMLFLSKNDDHVLDCAFEIDTHEDADILSKWL